MAGITITYTPSCDPVQITLDFPFYVKVDDNDYFKATQNKLVVVTQTKVEVYNTTDIQSAINNMFPGVNLKDNLTTEGAFKYVLNRNFTIYNQ